MKNNNLLYEEELFKQKYLKYKQKYIELKAQIGGVITTWEEFKKEKFISKFHLENIHAKKWDEIYVYIQKKHKDVYLNPNFVIKNYIIRNNKKDTFEGAMELLGTKWWENPINYKIDIEKEKEDSIKRLEDSNKAWRDAEDKRNKEAQAKGFKDDKDKRDKEAQAKGFRDAEDMMHSLYLREQQAAENAQARKEGFKDAQDKRNKEAQAKGFRNAEDMMRSSYLR
jgi:hypothetical protein